MKINVIEKRNNVLLDRVDVIFEVEADNVTPKRLEVKAKLAALINHDENLVIIKKIQQNTGLKKSKGLAHAYKSLEQLKRIEPKYLIKRNSPKPPPGEEAKEEEKKEEKKKPEIIKKHEASKKEDEGKEERKEEKEKS